MNHFRFYKGFTVDGSIRLKDPFGNFYMIGEGDEIVFGITDSPESRNDIINVVLTADDEIMAEYPFKLYAQYTDIEGRLYYYVAVNFADGDSYLAVPYTPFRPETKAVDYAPERNIIYGQVPRMLVITETDEEETDTNETEVNEN